MGVIMPGDGIVTENSALPDIMREGEGSGAVLEDGRVPRLAKVIWLILGEVISASTDSTDVMGAADGVCESSSVGCVASLR